MVAKRVDSTLCYSFGDDVVVADGDGDGFIKFVGDSMMLCFIIIETGLCTLRIRRWWCLLSGVDGRK
jgi:hypothetical protein